MIKTGTILTWNWGNGTATGKVQEVFHEKVTRTLQGTEVTKNGTSDNPAYLIKQADGDKVLKLQSKVERKN